MATYNSLAPTTIPPPSVASPGASASIRTRTDGDGLELGFRNLTYSVQVGKKGFCGTKGSGEQLVQSKKILSDVSGVCQPGRLLAIMGPSGAGKTSLLDVLAARKCQTAGELCLGPRANPAPSELQQMSSYVQQDDAILASMTVREAITMAALLTLPRDMPHATKVKRANEMLRRFHLETCAETLVGNPVGYMKGVSGGERKRCAVAMSTVRKPKILFLDEPTSGLDSYKAFLLVQILKELAREDNSTIVFTIHQPSSDIFALFDDLYVLLEGSAVYNGEAAGAVEYFSNIGYTCPQYANPADYFFMHVLAVNDGGDEASDRLELAKKRWEELSAAWEQSSQRQENQNAVAMAFKLAEAKPNTPVVTKAIMAEQTSSLTQFRVLFWRSINDMKRDKMRVKAQFMQSIVMSIIMTIVWWQVDNTQKGVQDRAGCIFFITTNGVMMNAMPVLSTFRAERDAVLREQENGMYRTLAYFFARVLPDIPPKLLSAAVFSTIAYWGIGFQDDAYKFGIFIMINMLLFLAGNSIGLFLACIFPDIAIALAVAPIVLLPLIMFSGFALNAGSTPVYLEWVRWLSPPQYAFTAIALNEFRGLDLRCTQDQLREVVQNDGTILKICSYEDGDTYIGDLNIEDFLTIETCCALLGLIFLALTALAYVGLEAVSRQTKAKSRGRRVKE